nr:hypothetical protein [Tanacetum cinerariifolium]
MILNSIQNDPLVWPTIIKEDGTTKTKRYKELSVAKKLQAGCDLKAINFVLQGLPSNVYAIVNHHKVAKEIWDRVKLLIQGTKLSLQEKECLAVLVFNQGDDPISCLNTVMAFLTAVASLRFLLTKNQLRTSSNLRNQATIKTAGLLYNKFKEGKDKVMLTKGLDAYDSDCDDVSNAKAILMANLSNCGLDVISNVPHFEPYHNDMDNQSEKANQEKNNESLTAKIERYKERVKTFEQRLNIDLSTHEKTIDSEMDDMIKEKLALK